MKPFQTILQREKLSKIERILNPSQKARETFRAMLIKKGRYQRTIATSNWQDAYSLDSEFDE